MQAALKVESGVIASPKYDNQVLIEMFLHGRSSHTVRAYCSELSKFFDFVKKPVEFVTLPDLQSYSTRLSGLGLSISSVYRGLAAVKSFFSFLVKIGFLKINVSSVLRLPAYKKTLSNRILSHEEVQKLIEACPKARDNALLSLMFVGGLRVSEACGLIFNDLVQSKNGDGFLTVQGKGGKTRVILLPRKITDQLVSLRGNEFLDCSPVFMGRGGKNLDSSTAWRIVRSAAIRAGINKPVSCHWLRHSHATISLIKKCPIHILAATLGHTSLISTTAYCHARPNESSSTYLAD
jgi:integrase/recombinase XerD